jgi:hypothetical protein
MIVVVEVNRDEINDERLILSRGGDIHGVELVRAETPTALLVPLPNSVELRTERSEYVVRRCRALRILRDRLDVFRGGLPTRGPPQSPDGEPTGTEARGGEQPRTTWLPGRGAG